MDEAGKQRSEFLPAGPCHCWLAPAGGALCHAVLGLCCAQTQYAHCGHHPSTSTLYHKLISVEKGLMRHCCQSNSVYLSCCRRAVMSLCSLGTCFSYSWAQSAAHVLSSFCAFSTSF